MTNYIEKMMMTAGVESNSWCAPIGADCSKGCDECQRNNVKYPDFTAEKQLEFIKLIGKTTAILIKQDCIFYGFETNNPKDLICIEGDFTQALAQLTTELMNAGKLDKVKIKEILENG